MKFSVKHSGNYFTLIPSGPINEGAIIAMLDDLLSHEDWEPGMLILTDECGLDATGIPADSIRNIADACAQRRVQF